MSARALVLAFALAGAASLAASGCTSLLPTHDVIRSLDRNDVDVVVSKGADRYPQLGRLVETEGVVLALDSVIVGSKLAEADDRRLIGTFASYMLGESLGKTWVSRVAEQRVVFGQGQVAFVVRRGERERYLVDLMGTITLFLPLASAPGLGKADGVEAVSFEIGSANQLLDLPPEGGTVAFHAELAPRNAIYSQGRPTFDRWEKTLFHLDWNRGNTPEARRRAAQEFLANARAQLGALVRLELRVERETDGSSAIAVGSPNAIELVLPNGLLTADAGLERATRRLCEAYPECVTRRGDDLLIRVGSFFFHDDTTGPEPPSGERRAEVAARKRFRIPPADPQAASVSSSAATR